MRFALTQGFINDWYLKSPLGTYTDSETTSVCGSLRTAINHIKTQNPNIKIYVVLDHCGQVYENITFASTAKINNLTQSEYYDECAKVCESLGVTAIKQYETSGISEQTPQYFLDQIHLNELGAEQSAKAIWNGMKK